MPPAHELSELMKWSRREEWRPHLRAVLAEHFKPAMDAFELRFEEIDDALGGTWGMTLWGCAFEDFLTRRFEPDARNPVEDYLRRRGWKERPPTRAYMGALQVSVMSLYEVSDIVPGQSFSARDLIRGGEAVPVSERTATQTLKEWDRIAARLVPRDDRTVLGGGLLAFSLEASKQLFASLREHVPDASRGRRGSMKADEPLEGWHGSEVVDLQPAAPLFTTAWLFDVLPRALGTDSRKLYNSDGDAVVFHTVSFPMAPGATADKVARQLNRLGQLRQGNPTFWNWLGEPSSQTAAVKGMHGLMWNVLLDDGSVVLGTIEVRGRLVSLSVSSAARAERGSDLLATALAGLVGAPLTQIQTVEQARAASPKQHSLGDPVPPEVKTKLVHDMLDRQYLALIDQPAPMLGDVSPRAAARSASGRKGVAVWLKQAENNSRHVADGNDPMATYDFSWLWRELQVEDLRH
jgi:hypothetical protein